MLCSFIEQHVLDAGVTAAFGKTMGENERKATTSPGEAAGTPMPEKKLTPAAQRALAEAAARREAEAGEAVARPKEIAGRDGPDPVRYGDWEAKGIASDF
jgi:hypothetical protein